jgi:hypothetical protein
MIDLCDIFDRILLLINSLINKQFVENGICLIIDLR